MMMTYLGDISLKKEIIKSDTNFKSRVKKFSIANELIYYSNPSFYNYATKQKRLDVITLLCRRFFVDEHETLSITKQICNNNFGISENSVTSIINTLDAKKSISISRNNRDRRELIIEPTDKGLAEMFLFFIRASHSESNVCVSREDISHHNELYKFIINFSSHLILGYSITAFVPLSKTFLNNAGGRIIMFHLYNEIRDYNFGMYKTHCTHASLWSTLKISRTQINRILVSAKKNKLLSIDHVGHISLSNTFIHLIEDYYAVLITLYKDKIIES